MKNLLEYVQPEEIFYEPFPHIISQNLLPSDLYEALSRSFPSLDVVVAGAPYTSNQRFDYTIKQLRERKEINPLWQEFCEVNASDLFFKKLTEIFGATIETRYPTLSRERLSHMRTGTRYLTAHDECDVLLDVHISVNTPVTGRPGSVRAAHVDDPRKLYGGLFYFRDPHDMTEGGDLELYRYVRDDYRFYGQHVDAKYIEVVQTVPYRPNTFVFFINTINSLHGVTVRAQTPSVRRFLNLVGELKDPLFDITARQESGLMKRYRHYKAKLTGQGGKW